MYTVHDAQHSHTNYETMTTHQLEWVAVRWSQMMSSHFLRLQLLKGEKRQRKEDGENGMVWREGERERGGEGERGRGGGVEVVRVMA